MFMIEYDSMFYIIYFYSISTVWVRQLHFEKRERSNYQGDKDVHSSPHRMLASSHGGGSESMHDTMVGRQRLDLSLDVSCLSIMIINLAKVAKNVKHTYKVSVKSAIKLRKK